MSPKFRLTQPAIQDIEQIADYIASRSGLDRIDRFLSNLDSKFAKIAQFPNIGRQREEILPLLRSLSIDNYLILYMPIGQNVEIFRVVSGYRDLSTLFADADD
ncbi:type II toxin-antitoxin system RelE/ParE family toxin [Microcoleus sp. S13_B4]|uniref:type II toxin-antitoxin system RelE/ParE family toxin n=1 Tax=Microcoleus sp. S13_B4 TaxID=3055408 RepID=UPI002FD0A29A